MTRSDNYPHCGNMSRLVSGSGRIFVYTGFPVKSAMVVPVDKPPEVSLYPDTAFAEKDGFFVIYEAAPENTFIRFTYQAS